MVELAAILTRDADKASINFWGVIFSGLLNDIFLTVFVDIIFAIVLGMILSKSLKAIKKLTENKIDF